METNAHQAGFSPDRLATLDAFVQRRYVEAGRFPGALTLIWRRGQIAHLRALGPWNHTRRSCGRERIAVGVTPSSIRKQAITYGIRT